MVELGCPPLKALVQQRQSKFFKYMKTDRSGMADDPLNFMLSLNINSNTVTGKYIKDLIESRKDYIEEGMAKIKNSVNTSDSSKCRYYRTVNPNMKVHDIYESKSNINEIERVSWSRLRLSAHSLAIETGRWNRRGRGRLPEDQRLCQCGQIQSERHVIEECPLSQHIKDLYNVNSLENLFLERNDFSTICHICHSILNIYL